MSFTHHAPDKAEQLPEKALQLNVAVRIARINATKENKNGD
jgi:hypothetical protein